MLMGTHMLIYSADAEADRAFLRDVLGLSSVDAGEGWLIFALPPAELGVHPAGEHDGPAAANESWSGQAKTSMFFMVADIAAAVADLRGKGVACGDPQDEGWGISSFLTLPSGAVLGIYQPRHPLAITV